MTDPTNSDDFPPIPLHPPVPHSPAPLAPPPGAPAGPPPQRPAPQAPNQPPASDPNDTPPGYTAHRPGLASAPAFDRKGNWFGAIAAALAIQIAASLVLGLAAVIAIVAALAGFGGESSTGTSWFLLVAVPVALIALALYVVSGLVASKVARDGRGWLMLIAGPVILGGVLALLGALGN